MKLNGFLLKKKSRSSNFTLNFTYFSGLARTLEFLLKIVIIFLIKTLRKIKKRLLLSYLNFLNFFGLAHSQFSDGLFFGSFCLLFFRFFFRLFFSLNPFWVFNFFILFLGFFIHIKYNTLKNVRESYVKILKILLGKNYWHFYLGHEKYFFIQKYQKEPPKVYFYETSFFNKVFQQVFIFFIFLRLWILKSPYKFVFFNFLLTMFLIFNEFFLFASFSSFLIIASRLSLFVSDYTAEDFFDVINVVEKINIRKEFIKPSWENATIINFIVIRTFYFGEPAKYYGFFRKNGGLNLFYEKYIQYDMEFKKYSDFLAFGYMSVHFKLRKGFELEENDRPPVPYKEIIKKQNKPRKFFFRWRGVERGVLLSGGVFGSLGPPKAEKKINEVFKFTFFKFVKPPGSPFPVEVKVSAIAKNHPQLYCYEKNSFFGAVNKSSFRNKPKNAFRSPYPEEDPNNPHKYTGRSINRSMTVRQLSLVEDKQLDEHIQLLYAKKEIVEEKLPDDYFFHCIADPLPKHISKELIYFYEKISSKTELISPDELNCMLLYLNPMATKLQILDGISASIDYFTLMLEKKLPFNQASLYEELLTDLTKPNGCKEIIENIPETAFPTKHSVAWDLKILILQKINSDLQNSNKAPFIQHSSTYSKLFTNKDAALRHINNLKRVKGVEGGQSDKHMVLNHNLLIESKPEEPIS